MADEYFKHIASFSSDAIETQPKFTKVSRNSGRIEKSAFSPVGISIQDEVNSIVPKEVQVPVYQFKEDPDSCYENHFYDPTLGEEPEDDDWHGWLNEACKKENEDGDEYYEVMEQNLNKTLAIDNN
ncbi:hypothetical protein OS493_019366 [Desmophyllum pertusum]|uniref:Uncharacterized protein n=1 Tax=Desmophyllum pertusum TaxID=174260 RepID=A0A9X0A189_9CNID|nr:hypothetical protein OS493_019366 [Desmophyllum pertusum]